MNDPTGRFFRKGSRFDRLFDNVLKSDYGKKKDIFPVVQRPSPLLSRVRTRTDTRWSFAPKPNERPKEFPPAGREGAGVSSTYSWKKHNTEDLMEMLEAGTRDVFEHGDFGKLSPAAAARFEIMDELISRGYTEGQLTRLMYTKVTGKQSPQNYNASEIHLARGVSESPAYELSYGIYVYNPMGLVEFEKHVDEFKTTYGIGDDQIAAWRANIAKLWEAIEKAKSQKAPTHSYGGLDHYLVAVTQYPKEATEIADYLRGLGTESVRVLEQRGPRVKMIKGDTGLERPRGIRVIEREPVIPVKPTWGQLVGQTFETRQVGQKAGFGIVSEAAPNAQSLLGIPREKFMTDLRWHVEVVDVNKIATSGAGDATKVADAQKALKAGESIDPPMLIGDTLVGGNERVAALKMEGRTGIIVLRAQPLGVVPSRSASDMSDQKIYPKVGDIITLSINPSNNIFWSEDGLQVYTMQDDTRVNMKVIKIENMPNSLGGITRYYTLVNVDTMNVKSMSDKDIPVLPLTRPDLGISHLAGIMVTIQPSQAFTVTNLDIHKWFMVGSGLSGSGMSMSTRTGSKKAIEAYDEALLLGKKLKSEGATPEAAHEAIRVNLETVHGVPRAVAITMGFQVLKEVYGLFSKSDVSTYAPHLQDVMGMPMNTSNMAPYVGEDAVYGVVMRDAEKIFNIPESEFKQMRWKATEVHPRKVDGFVAGMSWLLHERFDDYSVHDAGMAKVILYDMVERKEMPADVLAALNVTGVMNATVVDKLAYYVAEAGKCIDDIRLRRPEDIPVLINGQALYGIGRLAVYQWKGMSHITVFMGQWPPGSQPAESECGVSESRPTAEVIQALMRYMWAAHTAFTDGDLVMAEKSQKVALGLYQALTELEQSNFNVNYPNTRKLLFHTPYKWPSVVAQESGTTLDVVLVSAKQEMQAFSPSSMSEYKASFDVHTDIASMIEWAYNHQYSHPEDARRRVMEVAQVWDYVLERKDRMEFATKYPSQFRQYGELWEKMGIAVGMWKPGMSMSPAQPGTHQVALPIVNEPQGQIEITFIDADRRYSTEKGRLEGIDKITKFITDHDGKVNKQRTWEIRDLTGKMWYYLKMEGQVPRLRVPQKIIEETLKPDGHPMWDVSFYDISDTRSPEDMELYVYAHLASIWAQNAKYGQRTASDSILKDMMPHYQKAGDRNHTMMMSNFPNLHMLGTVSLPERPTQEFIGAIDQEAVELKKHMSKYFSNDPYSYYDPEKPTPPPLTYVDWKAAAVGEGWAIEDYKDKAYRVVDDGARQMFMHIAAEEQQHLDMLLDRMHKLGIYPENVPGVSKDEFWPKGIARHPDGVPPGKIRVLFKKDYFTEDSRRKGVASVEAFFRDRRGMILRMNTWEESTQFKGSLYHLYVEGWIDPSFAPPGANDKDTLQLSMSDMGGISTKKFKWGPTDHGPGEGRIHVPSLDVWVDASIAKLVERLNTSGYVTWSSCSGVMADHPSYNHEEYHPYPSMIFPSSKNSPEKLARVKDAATKAGFDVVYGQTHIDILHKEGEAAGPEPMMEMSYMMFEPEPGEKPTPDADIVKMWQDFESNLFDVSMQRVEPGAHQTELRCPKCGRVYTVATGWTAFTCYKCGTMITREVTKYPEYGNRDIRRDWNNASQVERYDMLAYSAPKPALLEIRGDTFKPFDALNMQMQSRYERAYFMWLREGNQPIGTKPKPTTTMDTIGNVAIVDTPTSVTLTTARAHETELDQLVNKMIAEKPSWDMSRTYHSSGAEKTVTVVFTKKDESESYMDVQLFVTPIEISTWYSSFPDAEILESFGTPYGMVTIYNLPASKYSAYTKRTIDPEMIEIIEKYNMNVPSDARGVKNWNDPGTVWAGNLSLNWGKKMADMFPELNYPVDEIAAAMYHKLTTATGTTPEGRPIDARYAWTHGRAKGVQSYLEGALRTFKEGAPGIYGPPAGELKGVPAPESIPPPERPTVIAPQAGMHITLRGEDEGPGAPAAPPAQPAAPVPARRGPGRPPGPTPRGRPKSKAKSESEFDMYDDVAKDWAKAFSTPAEYDECRLKVREHMRNKGYPPKMMERIKEFIHKSYTGEDMDKIYPGLIRAIDDLGGAFHMTDT